MLCCLALTLVALDGVRRHWRWAIVVAGAMAAALLVKGVFVAFDRAGGGVVDAAQSGAARRGECTAVRGDRARVDDDGARRRGVRRVGCRQVTGEAFWGPYWHRQVTPVAVATPHVAVVTELRHLGFYLLVLLRPSRALERRNCARGVALPPQPGHHRARALPVGEQRAIAFVASTSPS